MTEDRNQEARFTDVVLGLLPTVPVSPALEARILDDFDRIAARRAPGVLVRAFWRWRDSLWPGAPLWKPASVLALSLAIGVMAGVLIPASDLAASTSSDQQYAAADDPPVVNMAGDL